MIERKAYTAFGETGRHRSSSSSSISNNISRYNGADGGGGVLKLRVFTTQPSINQHSWLNY